MKLVKSGYKFWVATPPVEYAIKCCPYMGNDKNYQADLRLDKSVVVNLANYSL